MMKLVGTDTRYIACDEHGLRRRAYVACKHVLGSRQRIAHHAPWENDPDGMGELLCDLPAEKHDMEDLQVICEDHLIEMGLLPWSPN